MRPTSLDHLADPEGNEYLRNGYETGNTKSHVKWEGDSTRAVTSSPRLASGKALRTAAGAAISKRVCRLASQSAGKNLPSQKRLSNKTQDDVSTFAVQVIRPLAASFVLLPLHDGKAVEQNED